MFYMQEFEIVRDGRFYVALPFDLDGGTQGETYPEAVEMAGEWLRGEIQNALMHEAELPSPTFGNDSRQGGTVVLVGIGTTLHDVPSVSASEAAIMLDVSRPRITKMLQTGHLEGWKDGRNTRVAIASINARLEEHAAKTLVSKPVTAA